MLSLLVNILFLCYVTAQDISLPEEDRMIEGYYGAMYSYDSCPALKLDLEDTKQVLNNMRDGVLQDLCSGDGEWNCTKIVVYSSGPSAIKQATRFGLFYLYGLTQDNQYPSFYRPADGQYLFYLMEIGRWEYWHQYERWVIGPIHGVAHGGIMIRPYNPAKKCPWHMKWFRSHSYYHDQNHPNLWNPHGNPWVIDDTIRIECYDEARWPEYDCGCTKFNVTSTGRVAEYHPDRLGVYTKLEGKHKEGYLAPLYAKEDMSSYLFAHDILGRVWMLGSTPHSWSLRLNLLQSENLPECPFYPRPELDDYEDPEELAPMEKLGWEYLQSKRGEHEVWLKDYTMTVTCIQST